MVRRIGSDALWHLDSRLVARILDQLDARSVRSVFLTRLVFQSAPSLNIALALSGVGLRAYLTGTLLGLVLPITAYCLFFDLLARLAFPA